MNQSLVTTTIEMYYINHIDWSFYTLISQVICMLCALLNNFTSSETECSEPLLPLVLGGGLFVKKKMNKKQVSRKKLKFR